MLFQLTWVGVRVWMAVFPPTPAELALAGLERGLIPPDPPKPYFNRESAEDLLSRYLSIFSSQTQMYIALTGPKGCGTSTVLQNFFRQFQHSLMPARVEVFLV